MLFELLEPVKIDPTYFAISILIFPKENLGMMYIEIFAYYAKTCNL